MIYMRKSRPDVPCDDINIQKEIYLSRLFKWCIVNAPPTTCPFYHLCVPIMVATHTMLLYASTQCTHETRAHTIPSYNPRNTNSTKE